MYNLNIYSEFNENILLFVVIFFYCMISIIILYTKIKNIYFDYIQTTIDVEETDTDVVLIEINDLLNHSYELPATEKTENIYKIMLVIYYKILSKYNTFFVINDDYKNILRNIIKNDLLTNGNYRQSFLIMLNYLYSDLVQDFNIQLDNDTHTFYIEYIIKNYSNKINI